MYMNGFQSIGRVQSMIRNKLRKQISVDDKIPLKRFIRVANNHVLRERRLCL